MDPTPVDWTRALGALDELRREVSRLGERVAALEATGGPTARSESPPRVVTPTPERSAAPVDLDEELVAVISSAIAAFLGKKPHVRQIRLLGSAVWAQQGRATIQASHSLPVKHG